MAQRKLKMKEKVLMETKQGAAEGSVLWCMAGIAE